MFNLVNTGQHVFLQFEGPMEPGKQAPFGYHWAKKLIFTIILQLPESLEKAFSENSFMETLDSLYS